MQELVKGWIVNDGREREHGRSVSRSITGLSDRRREELDYLFVRTNHSQMFRGCDTDLGTDLVATLSGLYVHDLPHLRVVRDTAAGRRNVPEFSTTARSRLLKHPRRWWWWWYGDRFGDVQRRATDPGLLDVDANERGCRMRFAQTETDERSSHLGDARSRSNRDATRHTSRYVRFYSR